MIIVIQVIMTYVGGRVLRVVPLTLGEWGTVLLLSLSILVVGTLFKVIAQIIKAGGHGKMRTSFFHGPFFD